jgi:hypothetical protein
MIDITPWITQTFLKTQTPISQNIDISEVTNHITTAQLVNTREVLGKNLYDDLNTKFKGGTFSTHEQELFDILQYSIAYRASEIAIPFLGIKIRNKGVVKLNDEFGQPAQLNELKYLRNELADRAEYWEKRAMDYLCQYGTAFPLYLTSTDQQIYPNFNQPYDSDVYLGGELEWKRRRNRYYYGPNGEYPGRGY